MFYILAGIGGFLTVLGTLIFIVDAFKVRWTWGLATIFLPLAGLVCLCLHWRDTKRGFLLSVVAIPFLVGAGFMMPKPQIKSGVVKEEKDPFYQAMQKAQEAVAKVQNSRKDEALTGAPGVPSSTNGTNAVSISSPTPVLSFAQRLANNRSAFKALEADFSALNVKRKNLPKNDTVAIGAFNLEAKAYADKLAETRSEQAVLTELQRTAPKK